MKPVRSLSVASAHKKGSPNQRIQYMLEQNAKALSNVSFGTTISNADGDQNMAVFKVTGTTPGAPNTTFTVSHNLAHVPFGFFIIRTNKAAHIFDSGVAWTAATPTALGTISLQCDVATVVFSIAIT
jgi:hypothetical protein